MAEIVGTVGIDKDLIKLAESLLFDVKTGKVDGVVIFTYKQGLPVWDDAEGLLSAAYIHLDMHQMMIAMATAEQEDG